VLGASGEHECFPFSEILPHAFGPEDL
jgi:hypothetical protein